MDCEAQKIQNIFYNRSQPKKMTFSRLRKTKPSKDPEIHTHPIRGDPQNSVGFNFMKTAV